MFLSLLLSIISKIFFVPLAKFGFSKYPAGPFHKTVFESFITVLIEEIVFEEALEEEEVDEIFTIVEDQPAPPGGMSAFYKYVATTLRYPAQARRMGIEGKVFVQFVVDKDGSLTDVQAIKGIGAGCDEEAVRVISKAKKWKPGRQRGRAVKVRMILPITFKLG